METYQTWKIHSDNHHSHHIFRELLLCGALTEHYRDITSVNPPESPLNTYSAISTPVEELIPQRGGKIIQWKSKSTGNWSWSDAKRAYHSSVLLKLISQEANPDRTMLFPCFLPLDDSLRVSCSGHLIGCLHSSQLPYLWWLSVTPSSYCMCSYDWFQCPGYMGK